MNYPNGETIKKLRIQKNLTQSKLAAQYFQNAVTEQFMLFAQITPYMQRKFN